MSIVKNTGNILCIKIPRYRYNGIKMWWSIRSFGATTRCNL